MRNPYVTGAYVTGRRHYGREELLDYLLGGDSHAYWVVGSRRSGKTSLLRQLELLALSSRRFVPLYWDLQGSDSFERLGQYLADVTREHAERFEPLGLRDIVAVPEDALALLRNLRRLAAKAGRELLLLCDETEALLNIARLAPAAMQRLHCELTGGEGLRAVMASTRTIYQLHDICADWPTSPFLTGFDVSLTLGSLAPQSACALITQARAPEQEQVRAEPDLVAAIADFTNCHPYLLQVLCSRLFQEDGSLRSITDRDFAMEPMLRGFLNHDFSSLTAADRRILWAVHEAGLIAESRVPRPVRHGRDGLCGEEAASLPREGGSSTACPGLPAYPGPHGLLAYGERGAAGAGGERGHDAQSGAAELHRRIQDLEALGFLRRVHHGAPGGQLAIGNRFLATWLSRSPRGLGPVPLQTWPAAGMSDTAMDTALSQQQVQAASFLASQLNDRRARLVELEAVRARDFLAVPPQVLAEIEQIQSGIVQLRRNLAERSDISPCEVL